MKGILFAWAFALFALSPGCSATTTASTAYGIEGAIGLRSSYDKCFDGTGNQLIVWSKCTEAEYKYQDSRLNGAYKSLIFNLSEDEKILLRDSERKWISGRDAICAVSGVDRDGRFLESNDCAIELTAKRVTAIQSTNASSLTNLTSSDQSVRDWDGTLRTFLGDSGKIFNYQVGFLNDSAAPGALVVLDSMDDSKNDTSRTLLLVMPDSKGSLRKVAENNKIIPCKECGGSHTDDPFSFMSVAPRRFMLVISGGGSRDRWTDIYTFKFSSTKNNWFLARVVRSAADVDTGKSKVVDLSPKDFGEINFDNFNPKSLPDAALP